MLRDAALKPGKQRKPQPAARSPAGSTGLRSFRDTNPWGDQRGGERRLHGLPPGAPAPAPAPAPQQLQGKRRPGTQRSLSQPQPQGPRLGVCVCGWVLGFLGRMLWSCGFGDGVLNFLFCHSASSKRPRGWCLWALTRTPFLCFLFFLNEYGPFLLIYKDKEKDRQEALGGLKQVKTRKGRRF